MKIIVAIVSLCVVSVASLNAQNSTAVDSALAAIEHLYNTANYGPAELESRRLLETEGIWDSVKIQAEKWIAFSLIAQEKSAPARDRFGAILAINPHFELDPVLTSPKILAVFNDAKSNFLMQKKNSTDSVQTWTMRNEHSISFRTLIFPGWEQIHQGRDLHGYVLLGAGAASLGAGIAFEYLRSNAREQYLQAVTLSDISSRYDTYTTYRKAEVYSFITFAVIYAVSEIDVIHNFNSQTISVSSSYSLQSGLMMTFSAGF